VSLDLDYLSVWVKLTAIAEVEPSSRPEIMENKVNIPILL